jgi:hypothetical protein
MTEDDDVLILRARLRMNTYYRQRSNYRWRMVYWKIVLKHPIE